MVLASLNSPRLFLFDLDGVILDSRPNMEYAWRKVCAEYNINIPFERYFALIGIPFGDILQSLQISSDVEEIEKSFREFSLETLDSATFYEGVEPVCNWLLGEGHKLGIVTSKDIMRTKVVLSRMEVEFSVVCTPEERFRGKPAPDQILYAMAISNICPDRTVFIGDMHVDYEAARNAKVKFLHAKWGYGDLTGHNPDTIDSLFELKTLFINE